MKYIFTLLGLLILGICNAQSLVVNADSWNSTVRDILYISDIEYIVAASEEGSFFDKIHYYNNDTIAKTFNIIKSYDLDLYMQDEKAYLSITGHDECDISIPTYTLINLDTVTQEFLYSDYDTSIEEEYGSFIKYRSIDSNSFALINGYSHDGSTGVGIYNQNGILFQQERPNSNFTKISACDDWVVFFGGNELVAYSLSDSSITELDDPYDRYLDVEKGQNGHYYMLTSQFIIETDFKAFYDTTFLEHGNYFYLDILFTDKLYILIADEELNNYIFYLENNEIISAGSVLNTNRVYFNQMYNVYENEIWFAGQLAIYPLSGGPNGHYVISKIKDNLGEGPDFEVELLSVEGNGNNSLNFEIQLKNNSADTIRDINIHSTPIDAIWCSYSNLNIPSNILLPHEEKIVNGSVAFVVQYNFDDRVCVYATNSGTRLDKLPYDNMSCMQVTSVNDIKQKSLLEIYPNPVKDQIWLKNNDSETAYSIYTTAGIKVMHGLTQDNINIASIPNGLYILVLENGHINKFVKR